MSVEQDRYAKYGPIAVRLMAQRAEQERRAAAIREEGRAHRQADAQRRRRDRSAFLRAFSAKQAAAKAAGNTQPWTEYSRSSILYLGDGTVPVDPSNPQGPRETVIDCWLRTGEI